MTNNSQVAAGRRISPKAILILSILLLLICLPSAVAGILYAQGNKDPQAMVSALQHRFATVPTRVIFVTPTPVGTPGKVIVPTLTPTPVDIPIEAAKKIDDAKKFGGAVSKELETNPATRGFVGFLGQQLPKELPVVGGRSFGDAVLGISILLVISLLVLVVALKISERATRSTRKAVSSSGAYQKLKSDPWDFARLLAGVGLILGVFIFNVQDNLMKAFLLSVVPAFVILILVFVFEILKKETMEFINGVLSESLADPASRGCGFVYGVVFFVSVVIFALVATFGLLAAYVKDTTKVSANISKLVTNIPWLNEVLGKQLTGLVNFLTAAFELGSLLTPDRNLSLIAAMAGAALLVPNLRKFIKTEEE